MMQTDRSKREYIVYAQNKGLTLKTVIAPTQSTKATGRPTESVACFKHRLDPWLALYIREGSISKARDACHLLGERTSCGIQMQLWLMLYAGF